MSPGDELAARVELEWYVHPVADWEWPPVSRAALPDDVDRELATGYLRRVP